MHNLLCKIWQFSSRIKDHLFLRGCDFSYWDTPKELDGHEDKGNKYQPSTDSLKKVLKKLNISKDDSIIDIGCGKGKALYVMSKFPFKKVAGFDISKKLVDIAKKNMKILGVDKVEIFTADACDFNKYDDYNYFYMFNAVPEKVFKKTIDNIEKSLKRKQRDCYFIYLNPVCEDILLKNGFKEFDHYKSFIKWFDYKCYKKGKDDSHE